MSEASEVCHGCGWRNSLHFRYHGGVPVEHPICPSCGGELTWSYHFEAAEIHHAPDTMVGFIRADEAGFPEDVSPEVLELRERIEACLMERYGSPVPITNAEGVVDIEVRPYVVSSGEIAQGMKLIANVGRSVYSMALLEMLAQLNSKLESGAAVVPSPSAYGVPIGVTELFPFGTEVGLYVQQVIPRSELDDERWIASYDMYAKQAVDLARRLASTARLALQHEPERSTEAPTSVVETAGDEFAPSEPIALERARQVVLEPLFEYEHLEEEIDERIASFLEDLELESTRNGEAYLFALDSARVRVSLERRQERLLVRYDAVLLSQVVLSEEAPADAEAISRLLTTLNDQLMFGRCVLEPLDGDGVGQVVLEKTLLATDLDLIEFAVTLIVMAEEADRADNFLQEGLGGLRADQVERPDHEEATALEPLLRRFATSELPGFERLGREDGLLELRHLLEEVRLPIEEHSSGALAFTYGSSRIVGRVWEDDRATYLTLRATVLRDVQKTSGLGEALNACNRSIHFGAFALTSEREVEMVETIIIDDLSIEEFIYALVTLGELADTYDNMLQERFGGLLGVNDVSA